MEHSAVIPQLVAIVLLGSAAQWLAWRLRLPSILLLLLFGFLAGPVTGLVRPLELFGEALLPLVSLAVAIILFEGGLTLTWREIRATGNVVQRLVTVGALVTWIIGTLAAYWIVGLQWPLAILLGAILVVTGPTVIMPLLRHMRPSGPLGPVLKWEGIIIDPLGALLTVLVFEVIAAGELGSAPMHIGVAVFKTLVLGGGLGALAAGLITLAFGRFWIPDFLHNGVALALVVTVFFLANQLQHEAGLLAVTVMGMVLANQRFADLQHVLEFKENLRTLLISALFILLAARLRFEDFEGIGPSSVLFVLVLILLARPVSVLASTFGSRLSWRERFVIGWLAPRGIVAAAVASVFALRLEAAGYEQARLLVPLTFIAIVGTVVIYGLTAPLLARRLGVADPQAQGVLIVGAHKLPRELALALQKLKLRVLLVDTNYAAIRAARLASLPAYHGSILAEHAMEELDFGGIGRLMALTPNDEVNALAVQRFAALFGRASVFQLPPIEHTKSRFAHAKHLHGRYLFGKELTFWQLERRLEEDWIIKTTKLTAEFDYKSFRQRYGEEAILLFRLGEAKRLDIVTTDAKLEPRAGQTLIAMVREPQESRPDDAAAERTNAATPAPEGEAEKAPADAQAAPADAPA